MEAYSTEPRLGAVVQRSGGVCLDLDYFVEVRIEPQWAGLGELASLVPVLLIAQSCRFFK